MPAPVLHPNELERLTALHALHILDTPPEERFDRLVRLTQKLFNVPIALVSLVDLTRQWFKSRVGLEVVEMPRAISFCGHAILQKDPLIIENALTDPHVSDNPLVTGEPYIRFYAGIPLVSATGYNLGTLCLVDFEPRQFSADDVATLRDLALLAETELNAVQLNEALVNMRQSEKQKRLVLEASPEPIVFYDLSGRATYINPAFSQLFGWQEEELIGQRIDFVPEGERLNTQKAIEQLFRDKSITDFETRRLTKEGKIVDVDINAALILDEEGQATGTLVMFRDVTERQKARLARQQSEKRLRDLISNLAVGVLLFGKEGQILLENKIARDLLGAAYSEFVDLQSISSYLIDENRQLLQTHPIEQAFKGESVRHLVIGLTKQDNTTTWLLVDAAPQLDAQGQIHQVICSMIDITERKAAEEDRHYTKQLRVAAKISSELSTILDTKRLLQTTVSRLKEQLKLYHIHIYLFDNSRQKLVMRVGTGEVGWKLRQRNHSIPIDREQSIVARVAREATTLLVQDTLSNPSFLPNPLLPHTRSELAVPLIARGQLLGVLDVQDDKPNRFTRADMDILGTLAGQIATALENAHLFEEQTRSAAALRQSEERLRTVVNNADLMLFSIDTNGIFTLSEGRALARLELKPGQMVGLSVFEVYKDFPQILQDMRRALKGEAFKSVVKIDALIFDTWYSPLMDQTGELIGIIGVATDITEREEAQLAIFSQRAFLRQIIDLNPNLIFAKDRAGKFTLVNKAVAEAYGTTPKDLIGKTDADFNPNQKEVEQFLRDDLAVMDSLQEKFIPEEQITDSSGQVRWLQTFKRPIIEQNGKATQVLGVATDITQRKEAEQALLRERNLFIGGPVTVFRWINGANWPVEHVSQNVTQFGYTASELMSGTISYSNLVYPADLERVGLEVLTYTQAGRTTFEQEYRLVNPTGKIQWIYDFTVVIRNEQGEITHYDGYVLDITERKQAEEALRSSEARHRAILQATPDLMFRFNRQGVYLDLEAGLVDPLPRLLKKGQAIDRTELIGQTLHDYLPFDVAQKMLDAIELVLETNQMQTIDYELETEAGRMIYESRIVVSGQDEVLAVVRDITESKKAEAERQRFTNQLRTASLLTQQLTSILNPERLLQEIVTQLQERFDFYHVHIYLLDDRKGELIMRAGSGEVGSKLRELDHSIKLTRPQSIVARSARQQKMILVDNVLEVDYFYRNPLLPDTHSEVAIPLISREQVIGVLDVQDNQPYAFTQGDLDTLSTLAAQIATSLQNATLFEEVQRINETRLHAVLDNVLDGIITINDEGIIESFNPAAEQIFGVTAQKVVGQAMAAEKLIPEFKRLTEGYHESYGQAKDGSYFPIEVGLRTIELAKQRLVIAIVRDITERKKAEQALRESEERFRQMAENIGEVFWMSDPYKNQIIYISPAYEEIWGRTTESLYQYPRSFIDAIHPKDRKRIISLLPTQVEGLYNEEYRIIRPDGEIRWINDQAFPVHNEKGEVYRVVGVAHDITERKLAEAQRKHLKQLQVAADISEELTSILEHDRLLEAVVSRLQKNFEFYHVHIYLFDSANQVLLMEVGSGEVGQKLREEKHRIKLDFEHSIVAHAARKLKPVVVDDVRQSPHFLPNPYLPDTHSEIAVPILSAGQLLGVLDVQDDEVARFTANDIDVLRTIAGQVATALENARLFEQVEQNLEQTAIRFEISQVLAKSQTEENVLNAMIEQAILYNNSLNNSKAENDGDKQNEVRLQIIISTVVQEAEKQSFIIRRHHSAESQTMLLDPATILSQDSYPILNDLKVRAPLISGHIQQDQRFDHRVHEFYKRIGASSIAVFPLAIGRQLLGVMILCSSQTNRFNDEKMLYFYQSLAGQGAVALRSAQLFDHTQRTADHLRELDRLKSEFLANMSHELRTPLNSIIGYSEIMLMGINGPLNDDMREDMEAIRHSGQHLLRLINDILDLAKIEAGKMTLEVKELELSGLLDEVRVSHAALLRNKPIEMQIDIAPNMPRIHADRVRLNQILTNLVSNAIKFTEKGTIRLKATCHEDWVAIAILDQGIGIEKDDLPLIFAEFRQVDGSSTRRAEGTGLGLAITKHLVNMHGGTIKVESQLGVGTTFTVELPIMGPPNLI